MKHSRLKHTYLQTPVFLRLIAAVLITMTLFGAVIHFIEPDMFPTVFDGVWWSFVTAATVGYGDYVPATPVGRLVGILLILTGGGLLAFYVTRLSAATLLHEQHLTRGSVAYKEKDHYIIIGWNARAKKLLHLASAGEHDGDFVIIDRSTKKMPLNKFPIHFIKGDPSADETLRLANIQQAKAVIITSDLSLSPSESDNRTVLCTIAVRGNHPSIPIIAELLTDRQVGNALRAGASSIIRSDDYVSSILYHEIFHQHAAKPFENVLQILNSQQFIHDLLPESLANYSFADLLLQWKEKDRLLLGLIRNEQYVINPSAGYQLKKGDVLLSLSPWE